MLQLPDDNYKDGFYVDNGREQEKQTSASLRNKTLNKTQCDGIAARSHIIDRNILNENTLDESARDVQVALRKLREQANKLW